MRIDLALIACASLAFLGTSPSLNAHGGIYRGPTDTVPPHPGKNGGAPPTGGSTPTTPTPTGPTSPTPGLGGRRTTGGGRATGGGTRIGGSTTGGYGATISDDLSAWKYWWEYNKDRFLELKKAIHASAVISGSDDHILGRGHKAELRRSRAPSDRDRSSRLLPPLLAALDDKTNGRDIVSSSLVAIAKVGSDVDSKQFEERVLPRFERFLASGNQEIAETAALSMGIAGLPAAIPQLLALAKDDAKGRRLCKKTSGVPYRTRAFACYGLGLIAHRTRDLSVKQDVFTELSSLLQTGRSQRRDIQVAALGAIRILRTDSAKDAQALQSEALTFLEGYMTRKDVYPQVRAHAINAIGRCAPRDAKGRRASIAKLLSVISNKKRHFRQWEVQSAIQALGQIATADDQDVFVALRRYFLKGKNAQAKNFVMIAMGRIGSEQCRSFLYKQLRGRTLSRMHRPWAAFGLAILDHEKGRSSLAHELDSTSAEAIHKAMLGSRNALTASGYALALGIMRYEDAADDILDLLLKYKNREEAASYFCVALGLMRHSDAAEAIHDIVKNSTRRDTLLTQASIALGLLGDREIAGELLQRLEKGGSVAVVAALAQAIGFIGDRDSIDPLAKALGNKKLKMLPRAFAAVALGLVGDKESLPWNSKIAEGLNYRASVETLTGSGTGILDIL